MRAAVSSCALAAWVGAVSSCGLPLDLEARVPTYPIFDPSRGEIPMPNDALRDDDRGRLELPIDDELGPAERDFREWLNTRDGWSTTLPATVRFSEAIEASSVDEDRIQIWDWLPTPRRVMDVRLQLDEQDRRLSIIPPRTGWERGHRYVVVVRGGPDGVRDAQGYGIEPDAVFYFLRQTEKLDTIAHNRAFPGATRADRLETAARLEALRLELAPLFAFFEDRARPSESELPREEIAALWAFTVTSDPELAMDRDSQRVPLPFDLLIDPDTGLVALEEAEWDSELERTAKRQANRLDGFGVSANLFFELTAPVDPATLAANVHVFELGAGSSGVGTRELPAQIRLMGDDGEAACQVTPTPPDCIHVVVEIDDSALPLRGATTHVVVVDDGIRSAGGDLVEPMPIGHFMRTPYPLSIDGRSQIRSLSDMLAARLEGTRTRIDAFLDDYGREHVVTAWPFTTMNAVPSVREAASMATTLDLDVEPTVRERLPPDRALEAIFPGVEGAIPRGIYVGRIAGVREVVHGTLPTPYFLDPITRRWRNDGEHEIRPLRFHLAVPEGVNPGDPVPVVIFGHGLVCDSRFLTMIAGELASRGFATIGIDFPFHGERVTCVENTLIGIPNFLPDGLRNLTNLQEDILRFPPCQSGSDARCTADGRCVNADGNPDELTRFPLLAMDAASGAAFLDMHDLPHINDHFRQALVDLSTLFHAIRTADWMRAAGVRLDPDTVHYAGQSLGGIMGAIWVSVTPEIDRAVLNVPGSDMVDLFTESTLFGPQVVAYFRELEIRDPSFERERLTDVARWLIDTVDPHSVAHLLREDDRRVLLQMDRGDIVIPNRTTEILRRVSERPMRVYPSSLHVDLIAPVIGDQMLRDTAAFLAGEIDE